LIEKINVNPMNNNLIYNETLLIVIAIATAMFLVATMFLTLTFTIVSIFTQSE
jgi:hypothetical protein